MRIPDSRLEPLVRRHLSTQEDASTAELVVRLRAAKRRGYVTVSELVAVCYWKSPRAIHRIRSNSPARVRAATRSALSARSEDRRLEFLMDLSGVSVPMASALLTLLHPEKYGVLDIRVWQLLHAMGSVRSNPRGVGFNSGNWSEFVALLRRLARKFRVSARDIERTLFLIHHKYQAGRLYDRANPKG